MSIYIPYIGRNNTDHYNFLHVIDFLLDARELLADFLDGRFDGDLAFQLTSLYINDMHSMLKPTLTLKYFLHSAMPCRSSSSVASSLGL